MQICVFGMGNILLSDDGFGSHFAVRYKTELEELWPGHIRVIDMGAHDLDGLNFLDGCDVLYFIDVIRSDSDELIYLGRDELLENPESPIVMSTHSGGIQEILHTAEWMGILPAQIHLIGVRPYSLATSMSMTQQAAVRLPEVYEELKGRILSTKRDFSR